VLVPGCGPLFALQDRSVAPRARVGGYVLSKLLPLIVVVMIMLGAFYPAIDITAGERERGTLETILSAPVSRFDLMTGKVIRSTIEGDSDPLEMVPRLIELNASGEFDVDGLIATYPFSEINTAVADVLAGKVVKPVLVW